MRETQADLGHAAVRGRFVHLYLNGLYWGIYNLTERPNEDFASDHFGGKPGDYDARNAANILSGDDVTWNQMFTLANAGITNDTAFNAIAGLLDVPAFIDYMLLNLYAANADWDRSSNWYAARRRHPPGQFHFFVWDGERTVERIEDNILAFDDDHWRPEIQRLLKDYFPHRTVAVLHQFREAGLVP